MGGILSTVGKTNDLAMIVDPRRFADPAARQCPQVVELTVIPEDGMFIQQVIVNRIPRHIIRGIDCLGHTKVALRRNGPQIFEAALFTPHKTMSAEISE